MKFLSVRWVMPVVVLLTGGSYGQTKYEVTNLSSLGGTVSSGNSLNDLSWVAGTSNLPGDLITRASVWVQGVRFELRSLGGDNSGVIWPVKNTRGLISGIAETANKDPLGERWSCSAFFPTLTGHSCRGVVWELGTVRALPTLGGNNGFATGTNNLRQTVGWAENTVHDPTCVPPQQLQFRAAIWGPGRDQIRELAPLPGDTSTAATAINDHGQVVGISGICDRAVGRFSAAHAVMWENGTVVDLGNIGGVAWNTPMALNDWGDVVGFANIGAGGAFSAQAFLWTKEHGIQNLGTLDGDVFSEALGINDWRQVVGLSCSAGFATCRGFVWQNGKMTDMNELVVAGYPDHIYAAGDINNLGRIGGQSFNPATNVYSAFLAVPVGQQFQARASAPPAALPEEVREMLLRRHGLEERDR
jgi:probable HAF family extracellular repeat protein